MKRLAILGAGRIGKVHAAAIGASEQAELVAVADAVEPAAREIAEARGCAVKTISEIADDPAVDGIVICTPTDTHADLIEQFARAGKAIFCEKPIDLDVARVRACLQVVADCNAPLMVGFNRRFDPHFAALRHTVDDGGIGDVEMITITSRDPAPPPIDYIKRSGGIFRDMMIHDFDMARFLLSEEPNSVLATASVLIDPEIGEAGDFDSANAILRTPSGRQCIITNSRRATYGYDQRIEILGSRGMAAAENQRPVSIEVASDGGFTRPPLHDFFMTRYTEAYAAEISAFVRSMNGSRPAEPSGDDGLRALLLAEAATRSALEGRAVKPG